MTMKLKKLLIAVSSTICICLIAGIFLLFLTLRFVNYTPDTCAESTEELQNPYIGWYQIHNYMLSDTASYDLSEILDQEHRAGLALLDLFFWRSICKTMRTAPSAITVSPFSIRFWKAGSPRADS